MPSLSGPLSGVRIVEMAGIGPGPMCAMLLADLGAEVIRIDRLESANLGLPRDPKTDLLMRSRRSVAIDLKNQKGVDTALKLIDSADALIEGFRPGVMERLGLGPTLCHKRNPSLVYGRMTGWGQDGPLAHAAGHDINYISLIGALHAIGRKGEAPIHPLNLVGDFGGGALYLAMGVLAALLDARTSGKGQVVDCAMTDGAASLMTMFYGMHAVGRFTDDRGENAIDTGSHYYNVYETADDKYVSIGSIEPKFYAELLERLGLKGEELPPQQDPSAWPDLKHRVASIFRSKTRDEWCEIMEGTDVCFAPVLSLSESAKHAHNEARNTFVQIDGVTQPAPAPRFSRTPATISGPPCQPGQHSRKILSDWGFTATEIEDLENDRTIAQTENGK
ncbi:MAG: CaiB/BaiF CoA-transferase family protein [Pseudomonadales bacterium]